MRRSIVVVSAVIWLACNRGSAPQETAAPPPGPASGRITIPATDLPVFPAKIAAPPGHLEGLRSRIVTSSQFDTTGAGRTAITLSLPGNLSTAESLLATVAIGTVPASGCGGACPDAGSAAIVAPANAACVAAGNPDTCCTGHRVGTCNWTLVDSAACGRDLQVAVYSKPVEAGENNRTTYSWNFTSSGSPATFVGVIGVTAFAKLRPAPVDGVAHRCSTASATLTAPSITTQKDNSLNVLIYAIAGDYPIARTAGYSLIYSHSVAGAGPTLANNVALFPKGGSVTADRTTAAAGEADGVGFQIGLSALP